MFILKNIFRLVLLLLVLTGCSLKSLVIPNLAYIMTEGVDKKLDLYYSEEKIVQSDLEELLKSEVITVVDLKKNLSELTFENFNPELVARNFSKYYAYFAPKLNRILSKQMAKFTPERQGELLAIAIDDNKTIENRIKKKRTDEIVKRYEFIFGEMSKEQVKMIDKNMNLYQELNKKRLARRLAIQAELKIIFKEEKQELRQKRIESLFNSQIDIEKGLKDFSPVLKLVKNILSTLSKEQVKSFKSKQLLADDWLIAFIEYYTKQKE